MIYTASFFTPADHHGQVLSIANSQPRMKRMKRTESWPVLSELRPGHDLKRKFRGYWTSKEPGAWERYQQEYFALLCSREMAIQRRIDALLAEHGEITLCCWEPKPTECHRSFAAEFLRKRLGHEVAVR